MSLYGALSSGVSGVNAFSTEMAIRADNIANIATIGYKRGVADFSTLVSEAGQGNSIRYSSGGVIAQYRALIDDPGTILASDSSSDIAVNGSGFFVVNTQADASGDYAYTRAGSFRNDAKGNYVNTAGYTLLGWPLDNEGRLPGDTGNTNTTPNSLLTSLKPVNVKSIVGSASATTSVSIGANLNETQSILAGSGETITFSSAAIANHNIASNDPISPENSGANIFNIGDSLTLTPSDPGTPCSFVYGGVSLSSDLNAGVLGATTPQANFSGATSGQTFTITSGSNTQTFTYQANNPVTSSGQFNTPDNLVDSINLTSNLRARIVSDGASTKIIVTPINANSGLTFDTGTLATALGFTDVANDPSGKTFSSLGGLSSLINASTGVSSQVLNPLQGSALNFYATDPIGTLKVEAIPNATAVVPSNAVSILTELGLTPVDASVFGPAYDPSNINKNLAAGAVGAHFTRNVQVYDAFGTGHNIEIGFLKTAPNNWAVEIYSQNPTDLISSRTDGQLATGNISFNGDGTLRLVSSSLTTPIAINWANQSIASKITFDWGTAGAVQGTLGAVSTGKTDGLRQVDGDYNVDFVDQNGIPSGLLTNVTFDNAGYVIAAFSNGATRKVFQLPLAEFANPNGLRNKGGNAYSETNDSGNFNLKSPGSGGAGKIASSALEQSNVDLADEITSIIVTQRDYQANTTIIKTADQMLEELSRIKN